MISDTEARSIARLWHVGQGSPLYDLHSTGAITGDTVRDIKGCINKTGDRCDMSKLMDLLDYCDHHGPRGPVEDW